jgi:solute carrier family 25 carnitine/acylcarnitine transporter 20/29
MNVWLNDFICGSIAGTVGTLVGHPADTIKGRLQAFPKDYHNAIHAFNKILKEENFKGLFKGVLPPVLNQLPLSAFLFSEYYRMFKFLEKNRYYKISKKWNYFLSGCYSGIISLFFSVPFELIKCIQQLDQSNNNRINNNNISNKNNSFINLAIKIYKEKGLFGLYRGYWVMFNRDVISYGCYFYFYYIIRDYYEEQNKLDNMKILFAGGIGGIAAWVVSYPFDTLKTIIQGKNRANLSTQLQAYQYVVAKSGHAGLFRGLVSVINRAFYCNAIIFWTNEKTHLFTDKIFI